MMKLLKIFLITVFFMKMTEAALGTIKALNDLGLYCNNILPRKSTIYRALFTIAQYI